MTALFLPLQKHVKRVTQLMQKLLKQREKHRNLMLKQTHVHNLAMMGASTEIAGIKHQLSCQHDELESAQKQLAYLEDSTVRMTTEHCHVTRV